MSEYIKKIKQNFFGISVVVIFALFILLGFVKYFVFSDYDILLHVPCDNTSTDCVFDGEDNYIKIMAPAVLADSYSRCLSDGEYSCIDLFLEDSRVRVLDCEEFLEEGEICK